MHPDKNQDNKDRAQLAFEAVNKAWKTLENEVTRKKCLDIYEEAKDRTDHMVSVECFDFGCINKSICLNLDFREA